MTAMDGYLRPVVTCCAPAWFGPNLLTVFGEVAQSLRCHCDLHQLRQQTKCIQFSHGMRQQIDPHTQRLNLWNRLKHLHCNTALMKTERSHKATDTATHHDHLSLTHLGVAMGVIAV